MVNFKYKGIMDNHKIQETSKYLYKIKYHLLNSQTSKSRFASQNSNIAYSQGA